jgi:hypothetical protein
MIQNVPAGTFSISRAAQATLPRALEASDDVAVLRDLGELLDSAADVSDVKAVALAGHDALDVHDVLRTARHALVDDEVLGRAESTAWRSGASPTRPGRSDGPGRIDPPHLDGVDQA